MIDKIIQISSSSVVVVEGGAIQGSAMQRVVVVTFGVSESGNLYRLDGNKWELVTESPEKEVFT